MKVLNLYAGIGGNRALWKNCRVTAVEYDPAIAAVYQSLFPGDTVVVDDAHHYLLSRYHNFDFIWSSPPCPTHGQYRYNVGVRAKGYKAVFPDMRLYEEIVFLQYYFSGRWAVENVKPYYEPLIAPTALLGRHLLWANFDIAPRTFDASHLRRKNKISDFERSEVVAGSRIINKRQVLRNRVSPALGRYVLDQAFRVQPRLSAAA